MTGKVNLLIDDETDTVLIGDQNIHISELAHYVKARFSERFSDEEAHELQIAALEELKAMKAARLEAVKTVPEGREGVRGEVGELPEQPEKPEDFGGVELPSDLPKTSVICSKCGKEWASVSPSQGKQARCSCGGVGHKVAEIMIKAAEGVERVAEVVKPEPTVSEMVRPLGRDTLKATPDAPKPAKKSHKKKVPTVRTRFPTVAMGKMIAAGMGGDEKEWSKNAEKVWESIPIDIDMQPITIGTKEVLMAVGGATVLSFGAMKAKKWNLAEKLGGLAEMAGAFKDVKVDTPKPKPEK